MAKFDLEKTQALFELFSVPFEERDRDWLEDFYENIGDASLASMNPEVIMGPDQFPYFALRTPPSGEDFEPFCVTHVLDYCLEHGRGIVINPGRESRPDFVFSYGDLLNFKMTGSFASAIEPKNEIENEGDRQSSPGSDRSAGGEDQTVMIGQPSEELLPLFAKAVVKKYLKACGLPTPKMFLLADLKKSPAQNLIFNVFPQNFKNPEAYQAFMQRFRWFLPESIGLIGIDEGSELETHFSEM